jgi:hypothetical protein
MIGKIIQSAIQVWIGATGKKVKIADVPWLQGPVGTSNTIGEAFYQSYAEQEQLQIRRSANLGLVDDFEGIVDYAKAGSTKLNPKIIDFYNHTSAYKLDVWAQWYSFMRPFAKILIRFVSKQQNQLNIPLNALDTSYGMGSETIRLESPDQKISMSCWLRKTLKTNQVVYAGFYSAVHIPQLNRKGVRVVFPLPKGSVTVILRVEAQPDGSVKLISDKGPFGAAGYYRLQVAKNDHLRVKKLPLKEVIHVFEDAEQVLRTDHLFYFWGIKLLHLHYKIYPDASKGKN